jgi:hypothetical protein
MGHLNKYLAGYPFCLVVRIGYPCCGWGVGSVLAAKT